LSLGVLDDGLHGDHAQAFGVQQALDLQKFYPATPQVWRGVASDYLDATTYIRRVRREAQFDFGAVAWG
jgi:hypothetical protein